MGQGDKWKRLKNNRLYIFHMKIKKRFSVEIRSNGSKNVDFGWFLVIFHNTTPEMGKIWSHGATWQTKILKKYSTKNISLAYKKFRVNIRSKHKINGVVQKWPNFGRFLIKFYKAKVSWEKSEKSDASLWKYEQKTLILGYFGQKRANFEFSDKKRNCHFFIVTEQQLHEKNLMRGFLGNE